MTKVATKADINCEAGRLLGCQSFCCRLLVRLKVHEMVASADEFPAKGFVDKAPDGHCVHFDRENNLCKIWKERPEVCREYDCNSDFLLQVVLREGIKNIAEVSKRASEALIPKETYIRIPLLEED